MNIFFNLYKYCIKEYLQSNQFYIIIYFISLFYLLLSFLFYYFFFYSIQI
jgi:hypothetical protein